MHELEPYWKWRDIYISENDDKSPFYGRTYNEFEYSDSIYNYVIHPQWDFFGSETLYIKLLYVNYNKGTAIIEFIGEWNDVLGNDIMFLKRDFIDVLINNGICKFVLIGENILEFFADGNDYYEEWHQDICEQNGWIVALNFREHVVEEMHQSSLQQYVYFFNEGNDTLNWRKYKPHHLIQYIEEQKQKLLNE